MLLLGRARMLVRVLLSCDLAVIGTAVNCFLFHVTILRGWLNSPGKWLTVSLRVLVRQTPWPREGISQLLSGIHKPSFADDLYLVRNKRLVSY
jgi:hypothetical protein